MEMNRNEEILFRGFDFLFDLDSITVSLDSD